VRVIISGGGTGGHIYPGIAIADALKKAFEEINQNIEILFVGAEGKMEMEKVPKAGYRVIGLPIRGLQRSFSPKNILENLKFPVRLFGSLNQARNVIKEFKPDVVVGTGGYASGAVLQVATTMSIPTLIQEQNGHAGLTNKILSRQVDAICVAYPNMESYFPKQKIQFTGNPVRSDLKNLPHAVQSYFDYFNLMKGKKTILVMGGSGGAKVINEAILNGLETILENDFQLIWQTGKFYIDAIKKQLAQKNLLNHPHLFVNDFIYDIKKAYQCADTVVGRAGALTISELTLVEKPAILIPSPNVAEDHQTKNAMALAKEDAAMLIKDNEANERLIPTLIYVLNDENQQEKLKNNIKTFARPDAAKDIARRVMELGKLYPTIF